MPRGDVSRGAVRPWGRATGSAGTAARPLGGCPSCGEPVIAGQPVLPCVRARAGRERRQHPGDAVSAAGPAAAPVRWRSGGCARCCSATWWGSPRCRRRGIPEAVRELLSEYFAVARTVIGRYGGVVEKFIGDAVMAVWGTPVATEGDAERAVRAGAGPGGRGGRAGRRGGGAGAGGAGGGGDRRGGGHPGRRR